MTLGSNQKGDIQPHTAYAAQEILLSHNHLRIQDAFSASSVTNRFKKQTFTCVKSDMAHALCAVPGPPPGTAPQICCPTQACTKPSRRQPHSNYQLLHKVLPRVRGLQDFALWANFPIELNSLTKLWHKAAALSFLPSQTGEVNETTGTTALQTQIGKGTSVCRKHPLLLCLTFSRSWTAVYYYLLLRQCCLFLGCCSLGCKR